MQAVTTWFNRVATGGLVLLGLVIIATGIYMGVVAWAPTPVYDQWDAIAPEQLGNLFAPHNEHRIALTRTIQLADNAMAKGTGVISLSFVYLFSVVHVALLVILARWTWPDAGVTRLTAAGAAAAAFFFSGFQFENFSSGFQNQFVGVFLFATAGVMSLCIGAGREDGSRPAFICLSVLSAIVGAACMANGLLIAPLLAIVGVSLGLRFTPILMTLLALVSWALYFIDYPQQSGPGLFSTLVSDPAGFVINVIAYVGGAAPNSISAINDPFVHKVLIARVFGGVAMLSIVALAILALIKPLQSRPRVAAWAAIGIFVFASAAVTALGRGGLGEDAMLASRYGAGTAVVWAIVVIWAIMSARPQVLQSASLVGVGLLSVLLAYSQLKWIGASQDYKHRKLDAEAALLSLAASQQAYLRVYPDETRAPTVARMLRSKSLAMFHEPWRRLYGKALLESETICPGEVGGLVSLAAATEPTWRLSVSGEMPARARAIAISDARHMVVGLLIRGTSEDINSDLFGADDAPPLWQGYAHLLDHKPTSLMFNAVDGTGFPICRLQKTAPVDPVQTVRLAPSIAVGDALPVVGNPQISGIFPLSGAHEAVGKPRWGGRFWASWGGADSNTGRLVMTANVEGVDRVAIPMVTGPTPQGLHLTVKADDVTLADLNVPADLLRWSAIEFVLPAGAKSLEITVADASSAWGAWVGVGEPHLMCPGDKCAPRKCPDALSSGDMTSGMIGGVIDSIETQGDTLLVTGWAADLRARTPVDNVAAVVGGKILACVTPEIERLDVAASNNIPSLSHAGFALKAPAMAAANLEIYSRQENGVWARLAR